MGRKEGTIVYGGTYSDEKGYFVDPTVIRDIKRDARIANEEIFGPVLAVIKVDSFDEALDVANQTEYGLTGSKAIGCRINEHAAKISKGQKWIKRVVAEMGGKNAIIVDSSANIKKAAQGIANSAFTFQGQKCSACSRAIVMSDVYDELVDAVVEEAKKLKADQGAGRDNAAIGPVINQNA